jgi:hypothetical protein
MEGVLFDDQVIQILDVLNKSIKAIKPNVPPFIIERNQYIEVPVIYFVNKKENNENKIEYSYITNVGKLLQQYNDEELVSLNLFKAFQAPRSRINIIKIDRVKNKIKYKTSLDCFNIYTLDRDSSVVVVNDPVFNLQENTENKSDGSKIYTTIIHFKTGAKIELTDYFNEDEIIPRFNALREVISHKEEISWIKSEKEDKTVFFHTKDVLYFELTGTNCVK